MTVSPTNQANAARSVSSPAACSIVQARVNCLLLTKREGGEQSYRFAWHIALAVALEQRERSLRKISGQGGQCRKQQHFRIGRPGPQAFLGNLQRLR